MLFSHFFEQHSSAEPQIEPSRPQMSMLQIPPGHLPEQHSNGELHPLPLGEHTLWPQTPFVHAPEQQSPTF
jgi:hypothetical protein